ncbi:MAG: polysaccharide deacetylase family protein [Salinigranum sp.]
MATIPDRLRREVEAYFSFVSNAETERAIQARAYHVIRTFDDDDFASVLDVFEAAGATASVDFLGRDAEEQGAIMAAVDERGHEVVCHGQRHTMFGDLTYEEAHDELSTALDAIEDASGVSPNGFSAPFKQTSEGTLRAAAELGFEWVHGSADDADVPTEIDLVDTVYPHDTRMLEGGTPTEDAFDRLDEAAVDGATFLFHPNMLQYYGAMEAFEAWIEANDPVSIGEQTAAGEGVGVILDCIRPLRLE